MKWLYPLFTEDAMRQTFEKNGMMKALNKK